MNLLRPRYLALAFAAYFGVVCYYAAQEGRRAAFGAYGPGISLTVFQTTMVGAVLVLLGLFVTASISPQIKGAAPSRSPGSLGTSRVIRRLRGDSGMPDDYGTRLQVDSAWPAGDEFLAEPSDSDMSAYRDLEQAQDAAAVSAALSRLVPTGEPPAAGTLAERLSGMRARSSAVLVSEGRETAGVLLRLVNDMKPLLAAAKKVGLDLPELRRLVAEAAAGQEGDLSGRVRLVEQVKGTLEAALVERIAESLQHVLLDIERMKASTQQVHAAEMIAAEAVALLDTGNYAAAESLGALRPAFVKDGTITAGSSSPISDGAAAVVVMSRAKAEELGLPWLAEIGAHGVVAGPDASLHEQPSNAIRAALAKSGMTVDDLDLIEINEAFAAVGLVST